MASWFAIKLFPALSIPNSCWLKIQFDAASGTAMLLDSLQSPLRHCRSVMLTWFFTQHSMWLTLVEMRFGLVLLMTFFFCFAMRLFFCYRLMLFHQCNRFLSNDPNSSSLSMLCSSCSCRSCVMRMLLSMSTLFLCCHLSPFWCKKASRFV